MPHRVAGLWAKSHLVRDFLMIRCFCYPSPLIACYTPSSSPHSPLGPTIPTL